MCPFSVIAFILDNELLEIELILAEAKGTENREEEEEYHWHNICEYNYWTDDIENKGISKL